MWILICKEKFKWDCKKETTKQKWKTKGIYEYELEREFVFLDSNKNSVITNRKKIIREHIKI